MNKEETRKAYQWSMIQRENHKYYKHIEKSKVLSNYLKGGKDRMGLTTTNKQPRIYEGIISSTIGGSREIIHL